MARKKRMTGTPLRERAALQAADSQGDARLLRLAKRMQAAENALHAAMDELAGAERRLLEGSRKGRRRPAWYTAAVRREREAGSILEDVYASITAIRARTAGGLAIKVRLLATLFGQTPGQAPDESDMVSVLIHSLLKDVAE
ncbi:hypothetical protein [Enhydrobacter sp.]|jgi:hypothetical protein|uniref:hypothetical protein n=1 Tax=Enhydrobacter sp. TaxID=1894999 RepID=UPI002618F3AB|nr:hypothetical protein [Enhydrobacter sp.]